MPLKELEMDVPDYEKLHRATYAANVSWHVEYCMPVFVSINTAIKKLNLFTLQRRF